jgi:protein involved in polysaccharide export with SLBB domain
MRPIVLLLLLLLLAASPAQWAAAGQTPDPGPDVVSLEESTYRIAPGDVLDVKFVLNPELNDQVQVRPDGFISLAMVGELGVAGLTVSELARKLTKSFGAILKSPAVVVQVREFANRRVFVGGEVGRPGMFPLVGRQTALGAVMEAGGMKGSAKRGTITVLRRGNDDAPRVIRLSMKSANGAAPEASAFPLQPLDVVIVSESGVARANRAMDQYVRQMMPVLVTAGFSYVFGGGLFGVR